MNSVFHQALLRRHHTLFIGDCVGYAVCCCASDRAYVVTGGRWIIARGIHVVVRFHIWAQLELWRRRHRWIVVRIERVKMECFYSPAGLSWTHGLNSASMWVVQPVFADELDSHVAWSEGGVLACVSAVDITHKRRIRHKFIHHRIHNMNGLA